MTNAAIQLPTKVRSRSCYTQLLGAWAIKPEALTSGLEQVKAIGIENIWKANESKGEYPEFSPAIRQLVDMLPTEADGSRTIDYPFGSLDGRPLKAKHDHDDDEPHDPGPPPYINFRGTAIIPVNGHLSKHPTSLGHMFGGSSTVGMRKALKMALADSSVQRVMFHIDSPGGTVAGTGDLGDDIFAARSIKPISSYVEDLGASAAYWIASQTQTIFASRHSEVGSIGVLSVLYDESEAFAKEGVKVHVVKTGKNKGLGVPGTPITDELLSKVQAQVDKLNDVFVANISRGRNMPAASVRKIADGTVFMAEDALGLGLIDQLASFAEALAKFSAAEEKKPMVAEQSRSPATASIVHQTVMVNTNGDAATIASPILTDSNTSGDMEPSEAVVMANPETPAGKSEQSPVKTPDPALEAAQRDAKQALDAVAQMQRQLAEKDAQVLSTERERILADHAGIVEKADVEACKDIAALRSLEAVARRSKGSRSSADPAAGKQPEKAKEFDSWAAHETWKAGAGARGRALAAINNTESDA